MKHFREIHTFNIDHVASSTYKVITMIPVRILSAFLLLAVLSVYSAEAQNVIRVTQGVNKIDDAVFEADPGDIIELTTNGGLYREEISILIDKPITIRSSDSLTVLPTIFTEDGRTVFEVSDDLTLIGVMLDGARGGAETGAGIRAVDNAREGYSIVVENAVFRNFESAIRGSNAPAGLVSIHNSRFVDMTGRTIRFRDPVPAPERFELVNSTFWNSDGESVYPDNNVQGLGGENPELHIDQVTIHNSGGDYAIYPRAYPSGMIRNSIVSNDEPAGHGARIYGSTLLTNFLYFNKPDGIRTSDGASYDESLVLADVDPMYLAPELGNFRLHDASPAADFGHDGQPLGDARWWPQTAPVIDIDGMFDDWAIVQPIEMTEPQVDPAISDTFELKAVWAAADEEKISFRMDFFGDGNPALEDDSGPTNVNQGWHRVIIESADRLQRYRVRTYQGGSSSGDPVNFTQNRIRPEWRGDGTADNRGEGSRISGMVAWSPDGRSMEMAVPWDSLWVLDPQGDTLRIQRGDDIRVRYHIEAGDAGVGRNYLPAGEGDKLDSSGGYYTIVPAQYDLVATSAEYEDWAEGGIPERFVLNQNYPNPFNPTTTIQFALSEAAHARVTVYDVLGRRVAVLTDGMHTAGPHRVLFDASHLPSGTYFYRLEANSIMETRSMVLIK